MTQANASTNTVSKRYASALLDTAETANAVNNIESDFADLDTMMQGSEELRSFVKSPLHSSEDQKNVLIALADKAKFHDLTKNFLMLLVENRRVSALPSVITSLKEEMSSRRGEVRAKVQVANELSAKELKNLEKALSDSMGQAVAIEVETKADLIGGMVVTVGSKMIDDSVKRKLERLKAAMSAGANQNAAA